MARSGIWHLFICGAVGAIPLPAGRHLGPQGGTMDGKNQAAEPHGQATGQPASHSQGEGKSMIRSLQLETELDG